MVPAKRFGRPLGLLLPVIGLLGLFGCYNTPIDVSDFARGPAPLRTPPPAQGDCCYEDALEGQQVFVNYCAACHNARSLAERPFANYQNAVQHMRVRANLTGKEYAKLMAWLRRWHDIPAPDQPESSSPKQFIYSQRIDELRKEQPKAGLDPVAGPRAGAADTVTPGQPPPGNGPREGR
jgi:hypothetical protein